MTEKTPLGLSLPVINECLDAVLGAPRANFYTEAHLPPLAYRRSARQDATQLLQLVDYGEKFEDGTFEYRSVTLPKRLTALAPPELRGGALLTEWQWRSLGLTMGAGWEHYMIHRPEPHILLFRRERGYADRYGLVSAEHFGKARALHDALVAQQPSLSPNARWALETAMLFDTGREIADGDSGTPPSPHGDAAFLSVGADGPDRPPGDSQATSQQSVTLRIACAARSRPLHDLFSLDTALASRDSDELPPKSPLSG